MYDEFPHEVFRLQKVKVSDGMGGSTESWEPTESFFVFMDTPTTKDRIYAMQLNKTLDRFMYYPYGIKFEKNERIRFEGVDYEISGDGEGEDQGGMHEVLRMPLKKVT